MFCRKESTIVVEIEAEKIEDDVEDLRVQDHDRDLDEDQDRAIVDEEEGRLQAGQDHETDLVMGQGRAIRKFQKIQFEVENILQIQMRINQSKHEKTGSWIDSNVILGEILSFRIGIILIIKIFNCFSFERKFAMAEENVRKKNENKPKDEFGWDEAPVSVRDSGSRTVFDC